MKASPGTIGKPDSVDTSSGPGAVAIAASLPKFLPWAASWWFWPATLLGFAILVVLIYSVQRYVFLVDVERPLSLDGDVLIDKAVKEWKSRNKKEKDKEGPQTLRQTILLRFRVPRKYRENFEVVSPEDIRSEELKHLKLRLAPSHINHIVLQQFDYNLKEPEIIGKKLELLEWLNDEKSDAMIVIESSIDPLYFLTERFNDRYDRREALGISLERWSATLQSYARLRDYKVYNLKDYPSFGKVPKLDAEVCDTLIGEAWPNSRLYDIGLHIASSDETAAFSRETIIDNFLDLARPHYRRIWSSCSINEKMLLFRIAKEGYANRAAERTLKALIRRRLVVMDPNCRIMNESFRRFVLRAERPEVFKKWASEAGASDWSKLKTPVTFAVVALIVFFFATQRELFNQSLGVFAALAASAPAVVRLFAVAAESRSGGPSDGIRT